MFSLQLAASNIGSEIYLISIDEQDTLDHYTYQFTGSIYHNFLSACVDPELCYYIDVHTPETIPGLFNLLSMYFPEFGWPQSFIQFAPASSNFYRVQVSAIPGQCGVLGCTDTEALNYWELATENFGCTYCEDTLLRVSADFNLHGDLDYRIEQGEEILMYGSIDEQDEVDLICLPDGCYEWVMSGEAWQFNTLTLTKENGDTLATAFLSQDGEVRIPFGINTEPCEDPSEIYGCTNPLGSNYNATATIDNGSCILANDECSISFEIEQDSISQEVKFDTSIESIDYPIYIFWDFGDGSALEQDWWGSHQYDAPGIYEVCVYLYTTEFFTQQPVCSHVFCAELNTDLFGFQNGLIVFVEESTGLIENTKSLPLKIYPSPAIDQITIEIPENINTLDRLEIFNLQGQKVQAIGTLMPYDNRLTADISSLPSGMYVILGSDGENLFSGTIVKSKD